MNMAIIYFGNVTKCSLVEMADVLKYSAASIIS